MTASPPVYMAASTMALLAIGLPVAPATAQSVPGFTVETYAEGVPGPIFLAFAPDGTLFCGRDPSATGTITPLPITRIGIGGSPVEAYGLAPTPDPDPAVVDVEGVVSGTAGSVLTGGIKVYPTTGSISAIQPDQSVIELWTSTQWNNPFEMKFDQLGRLLFVDRDSRSVWTSEGGEAPTILATLPGNAEPSHLAIAPDNRFFVSDFNGRIYAFDEDGSLSEADVATFPSRVAIEFGTGAGFGTGLYALRLSPGTLHTVAADGTVKQIGSGFTGFPYDIAFGPDGRLYMSHITGQRISVITPGDGDREAEIPV